MSFEGRVRRGADAQEVVDEGEVAVFAVAAELGGKVEVGDLGACGLGPAANFVFGADVVDVDALVLVEEEDAAAGGIG